MVIQYYDQFECIKIPQNCKTYPLHSSLLQNQWNGLNWRNQSVGSFLLAFHIANFFNPTSHEVTPLLSQLMKQVSTMPPPPRVILAILDSL